jgi:transposase-like protein
VTKPFSVEFKHKMVKRLVGVNAVSSSELSRETGISQQNLSRWLREARSLPSVANRPFGTPFTVADKARILSEGAKLSAEQLQPYLEREGVRLAEYEQWRLALDEGAQTAVGTTKRIRQLERELARKEKALAEAAALLVLKKKAESWPWNQADEGDDTDESNDK